MDQMLPSPYNIPGIGTPLHQPEEDQQILPNAMQQQQQHQQQQSHSLSSMASPLVGFSLGTPQRSMHTYAPTASYATPQQMMQPQTPVSGIVYYFIRTISNFFLMLKVKGLGSYNIKHLLHEHKLRTEAISIGCLFNMNVVLADYLNKVIILGIHPGIIIKGIHSGIRIQ
jgi:hypothetical protein